MVDGSWMVRYTTPSVLYYCVLLQLIYIVQLKSYHVLQLNAVFHVVDKQGQKITDDKTIKYIEKVGKFCSNEIYANYIYSVNFTFFDSSVQLV